MTKDFERQAKAIAKMIQTEERGLNDRLWDYLNLERLKTKARLTKDMQDVYSLGFRYVSKLAKKKPKLSDINILAVKRTQGLQYIQGSNIDNTIVWTTLKKVKTIVADWLFDWDSYTEIAKKILDQAKNGVFSKNRSELIAINAVWNAYENGRKAQMDKLVQEWMDVKKYRHTVNDTRVTEQCKHNQSKWRLEYNQNRPSWDNIAPRRGNPRCRCTTEYDII